MAITSAAFKVRNELELKRNESKSSETKRNIPKQNETYKNNMKSIRAKGIKVIYCMYPFNMWWIQYLLKRKAQQVFLFKGMIAM